MTNEPTAEDIFAFELTPQEMVREFHRDFGHPDRIGREITARTAPERIRRIKLLFEEAFEFADACGIDIVLTEGETVSPGESIRFEDFNYNEIRHPDLVGMADALADIDYVTHGAGIVFGIDVDRLVQEVVHPSNMSKKHICESCGGKGHIINTWEKDAPIIPTVHCEACNGSGKVVVWNGSGKVVKPADFVDPKLAIAEWLHDEQERINNRYGESQE